MKRVLIANRGEISVRIARTLRELELESVAVYTAEDRLALHTRSADRAIELRSPLGYLDAAQLIDVARATGCDALHPATASSPRIRSSPPLAARPGLCFIGPPASAIAAMGSKQRARARMEASGVPLIPGGDARTLFEASATALRVGYPVLVKATDGGGGKGMRLVGSESELASALERTRSEPRVHLAATRCTSRRRSRTPATSRSKCWATSTESSSPCSSATARSSVDTKR